MNANTRGPWKEGTCSFGGYLCQSWTNPATQYMIVKIEAHLVGCRGAARCKWAYMIRHLPTGKEEILKPGYDFEPYLWEAKKIAELRAAIARAEGKEVTR